MIHNCLQGHENTAHTTLLEHCSILPQAFLVHFYIIKWAIILFIIVLVHHLIPLCFSERRLNLSTFQQQTISTKTATSIIISKVANVLLVITDELTDCKNLLFRNC